MHESILPPALNSKLSYRGKEVFRQALIHSSNFSRSECHKEYFARKARRVAAMFGPGTSKSVATEWKTGGIRAKRSRLVMVHVSWWREMLAAIKWGKLGSSESWNVRLKSLCCPVVDTMSHGGQIESCPVTMEARRKARRGTLYNWNFDAKRQPYKVSETFWTKVNRNKTISHTKWVKQSDPS